MRLSWNGGNLEWRGEAGLAFLLGYRYMGHLQYLSVYIGQE